MVLNWVSFCPTGDLGQCLETFLIVTAGGKGTTGIQPLEATCTTKRLKCPEQNKELSCPKCQYAQVEKHVQPNIRSKKGQG